MKARHFCGLLLLALVMTACQKNGYTIKGTVEGLNDGDTLLLTNDLVTGLPTDTIIVSDGRFSLKGTVDSAQLCLLYKPDASGASATFFLEPGTIQIAFSGEAGKSTVGGTKANDAWQQLNDLSMSYYKRMEEQYHSATNTQDDAFASQLDDNMAKLQQLQNELSQKVIELAEQNIDNELGYFIVANYTDEANLTPERRQQLIDKMPANFRERSFVKEFQEQIKTAQHIEKGNIIEDFTLNNPEGQPVSALSLVGQNRITILDFWASWCGPCRQETPFMVQLYKKYHDQGLGIIGISLDEDNAAWTAAIKELGMTWPQLSDLKGWKSQAAQQFMVNSIPFMIVLDQQGTILEKGLRGQDLEQFISEQLK